MKLMSCALAARCLPWERHPDIPASDHLTQGLQVPLLKVLTGGLSMVLTGMLSMVLTGMPSMVLRTLLSCHNFLLFASLTAGK